MYIINNALFDFLFNLLYLNLMVTCQVTHSTELVSLFYLHLNFAVLKFGSSIIVFLIFITLTDI